MGLFLDLGKPVLMKKSPPYAPVRCRTPTVLARSIERSIIPFQNTQEHYLTLSELRERSMQRWTFFQNPSKGYMNRFRFSSSSLGYPAQLQILTLWFATKLGGPCTLITDLCLLHPWKVSGSKTAEISSIFNRLEKYQGQMRMGGLTVQFCRNPQYWEYSTTD